MPSRKPSMRYGQMTQDSTMGVIIIDDSCCCYFVTKLCQTKFPTAWTAVCQASLSFTISQSLLKFMFIESVMLSNHLILCHPLLLLPSIFPSTRVFSDEWALCIRWLKFWNLSVSKGLPMNIQG